MAKNLVIVESPAKAKTIEKYLGKDYVVKSSFGHIRDLAKKNLGVNVDTDFRPVYEVDPDKKKIIAELKKLAKTSETVWLASDEDREGEAIAWHLSEALKLDPKKTKRIVFHEITKSAILNAIESPRSIDYNLVDAQQARRVLDRLVGFELSPLLWQKVKPSLSAGRVQSVAVRLIVEREKEINNFESTSLYKVSAVFSTSDGKSFNADLSTKFKTKEEASDFLEKCKAASFKISNIAKKPSKKSPAAPFTTSTLQQEASRKLGYSVSKTMMIAQQLYESGKITYMRTDSVNLSGLAINMAKEEITSQWGSDYVKTRKFKTSSKGAQEAHEAIRPTFLNNHSDGKDASQKRLYDLIWKRTIASQMSDAQIEKTIIDIEIDNNKYKFVANGEVIKFDGFLKVYNVSTDEEDAEPSADNKILPAVNKGDSLKANSITAIQRFTKHPPRYTEASLVRKMEELGIGRPSTYAPTISTIQKRGYVVKEEREGVIRKFIEFTLAEGVLSENKKSEKTGFEKNKLFPTDVGILVNDFLIKYFDNIIDYNFTATVEKEFDQIADGKVEWNKMIKSFYTGFHETIVHTKENAERFSGERLLGVDPNTGKNIYAKIGKYGPIVQMGETTDEEKPKFAGIQKPLTLADITLEDAFELFRFPRDLGEYENKKVVVAIGRFGPYVRHDSLFFSIPKTEDPSQINLEKAIELIEAKRQKDKENTIRVFDENTEVKVLNGRFGPYINYKKKNYKIPKTTDPASLSLEDCMELIAKAPAKKGASKKKTTPKKKASSKKKTTKKKATTTKKVTSKKKS
jgi:DNA topoisomerase-1